MNKPTQLDLAETEMIQEQIPEFFKQHFSLLLKYSRAIPWQFDLQTQRFTYIGSRIVSITGYTQQEWYEDGFWVRHMHPDDAGWAPNYCQTLTNNLEDHELEYRMFSKSGKTLWIKDSVIVVVRDNRPQTLVGFMFDITEEKERALALAESRHKLLESQRIARIGHWVWDIRQGSLEWSDFVYRLFGYEPREFSPEYKIFLSHVHPEDREKVEKTVIEALQKNNYSLDHRIISRTGEVFHVHEQAEVEYDGQGTPIRMFGTVQDISERKKIENALDTISNLSYGEDIHEYYNKCIEALAEIYQSDFTFLGKLTDDLQHIEVQSVYSEGRFVENFTYALEGTPCNDVISCKKELIAEGVSKQYPDDKMLVEMGIESYFGVPLRLANGEVLGLIAILNKQPMKISPWTESILRLFADRIAAYIDYKRSEERVLTSEQDLNNILQEMQDTFYRIDKNHVFVRLSRSVENLLGYRVDELIGTRLINLYVEPELAYRFLDDLEKNHGCVSDYEVALKHKDGSTVWVSCNAHFYRDLQGNIAGIEGMVKDITQEHYARVQMQKLSSALQHSGDMVLITDANGYIEYVNPKFEEITGYTLDEVKGKYTNILKSGVHDEGFYQKLWKTLRGGKTFETVMQNRKKNGDLYFEEKVITPVMDEQGRISNFVSTGRDISERIEYHNKLQFMARHDALTELPNRSYLIEHLNQLIEQASRNKQKFAVLFLDLDRFKNINDSLGHDTGDLLLIELANRISKLIRKDDIVARLGGDEFAVVLNNISEQSTIAAITQKLLDRLADTYCINDREFIITASIGISIFPDHGSDHQTLLKNADLAMYQAKAKGKNTFQLYAEDMGQQIKDQLIMEHDLHNALINEEFVLFYQPQVSMCDDQLVGMEALLRWQHQRTGLVPPDKFIPLLEETGLIIDVGYWIIKRACRQLKQWHEMGFDHLTMSINISAKQFHAAGFVDKLCHIIKFCQLQPHFVKLEITESILMEDQKQTLDTFHTLSEQGFQIALDDFGTGYSSLSYLRRFKVNELKVDKSFIRDVTIDPEDAAITSAIIAMARSLKLDVVAEGVETDEQIYFLSQNQCIIAQGFIYSRPLPAKKLTTLLEENRGIFLPNG